MTLIGVVRRDPRDRRSSADGGGALTSPLPPWERSPRSSLLGPLMDRFGPKAAVVVGHHRGQRDLLSRHAGAAARLITAIGILAYASAAATASVAQRHGRRLLSHHHPRQRRRLCHRHGAGRRHLRARLRRHPVRPQLPLQQVLLFIAAPDLVVAAGLHCAWTGCARRRLAEETASAGPFAPEKLPA